MARRYGVVSIADMPARQGPRWTDPLRPAGLCWRSLSCSGIACIRRFEQDGEGLLGEDLQRLVFFLS